MNSHSARLLGYGGTGDAGNVNLVNRTSTPHEWCKRMGFAEQLRALLAQRGVSQRTLARQVPCDKGLISRYVNGKQQPSARMARLIDAALGAAGELAALAAGSPDYFSSADSAAGWKMVAGMLPGERPRHVAPELVGYFSTQLAGHYAADMYLGPHLLLGTVAEQYRLIAGLAASAQDEVRLPLVRLAAAYAALAGWLCQDAGDLAQSAFWRAETLDMAHRAQDRQLVSYALVNKAMLTTDRSDGHATADLSAAALHDEAALSPKVRVLAHQQAAHGRSLIPNARARPAVDKLLDEAAVIAEQVEDDAPWGNACRRTPMYTEVQRATCYGRLGLARDAVGLWEQILPLVPGSARRDAGVYRARYAAALARSGHPEMAVVAAGDVARAVRDTGSARMKRELLGLREAMRPWRDEPLGRQLRDILMMVSHVN